ncbi:MAG: response regulator [Bradyrhizobium sp.]|uniref:response regulator n=1 Tax=Bradyrhizobium sp. TaxID=376 RepID=UPI001C28D3C2|nr:response regulator [Bradyrhizobium sp.]MBU6464051.1 response regulator [Pseudomonadota bacterium]MDE2066412.1 response regulator [Bradyrhizobium sp.]MDE2243217.1 response regulator [Bradyrhizobium sp.]MDE2470156.1 response regulator [Bradyrhizobium sp.]
MSNPLSQRSKVNLNCSRRAEDPAVVLVVEDEFLIRLAIAEELRIAGYRVVECRSADEALDLLHSGLSVDVIFTDVRMPGVFDGLDLARSVRDEFPAMHVFVTSTQQPGVEICAPFIPKPYDTSRVIQLIGNHLGTSNTSIR